MYHYYSSIYEKEHVKHNFLIILRIDVLSIDVIVILPHCKNEYALSNQKKKIVATDYKQYCSLNLTN